MAGLGSLETELVKVHLIDGTFELFRCFHGAPHAQTESGQEVGAGRAFLHTMLALLRQPDVSHLGIAFDRVSNPPDASDATPSSQHRLVADLSRALGLVVWPMVRRYEADDALASAAWLYKDAPGVEQVVICTADKDLAQCVQGTRVVVLDRIRKRLSDEEGVLERFGVAPSSIPDYLALVGDPGDGIPGVPGWGPKSAALLLSHYGRLEALPALATDWQVAVRGAERLAAAFQKRRLETLLCRDLATLATDVPLREDVSQLEWRGARQDLRDLAQRIGAADALEYVPQWLE